jgi:hypothetical protein
LPNIAKITALAGAQNIKAQGFYPARVHAGQGSVASFIPVNRDHARTGAGKSARQSKACRASRRRNQNGFAGSIALHAENTISYSLTAQSLTL